MLPRSLRWCNWIDDPVLKRIFVLCGGSLGQQGFIGSETPEFEELYVSGQYDLLEQLTAEALRHRADIKSLYYAIRARQHLRRDGEWRAMWPDTALITKIAVDLEKVVNFAPDASGAVQSLQKLVLIYINSAWAS